MNCFLILIILLNSQIIFAWDLSVGVGQRYFQSSIEDTSTAATAAYAGLGFEGELRYRPAATTDMQNEGLQASPEFFILGGSLNQQNSESSIGYNRKNTYTGGGMDFVFSHIFIGGQALNNSTSIESTAGTTEESFTSIAARLGYSTSIGKAGSGFSITVGVTSGLGRTASTTIPVNIITDNSFFINLQYSLIRTDGNQ